MQTAHPLVRHTSLFCTLVLSADNNPSSTNLQTFLSALGSSSSSSRQDAQAEAPENQTGDAGHSDPVLL